MIGGHRAGGARVRLLRRTLAGLAVAACFAVAVATCGASGSSDSAVRSRRPGSAHAAVGAPGEQGLQTVEYRGVAFDVPADWPVYDLAADPTTCVRFDVHAVYLGTPGADMRCPTGLVGRTDAILVQPSDAESARSTVASATGLSAQSVNGLAVQVANDATTGVVVAVTDAVTATMSTGTSDEVAQQILASLRAAGA